MSPLRPISFVLLFLIFSCSSSPKYKRADWGNWNDPDGNCLNTRHEILKKRSQSKIMIKNCRVLTGTWRDFYFDETHHSSIKVDIDHVVPLKHAFDSGGAKWSIEQKKQFALDEENLVITNRKYNRQKGAKDITNWVPLNRGHACRYANKWLTIKGKYQLTISNKELSSIKLLNCTQIFY